MCVERSEKEKESQHGFLCGHGRNGRGRISHRCCSPHPTGRPWRFLTRLPPSVGRHRHPRCPATLSTRLPIHKLSRPRTARRCCLPAGHAAAASRYGRASGAAGHGGCVATPGARPLASGNTLVADHAIAGLSPAGLTKTCKSWPTREMPPKRSRPCQAMTSKPKHSSECLPHGGRQHLSSSLVSGPFAAATPSLASSSASAFSTWRRSSSLGRVAALALCAATLVAHVVPAQTSIISRVAGNGTFGDPLIGSPATSSPLGSPGNVVVDSTGQPFFIDFTAKKILTVGANGDLLTAVDLAGFGLGAALGLTRKTACFGPCPRHLNL